MAVTGTGTGVLKMTASGDAVTEIYILDSLRWIGATAAGHRCSVTDTSGNVLFESEADGANFLDGWVFAHLWANGVTVATMQSGALNMYVSARG